MGIWNRAIKLFSGKPSARDIEDKYLLDIANKYRWCEGLESHWLSRNILMFDNIPYGSLPVYHTDDFGVTWNIYPTGSSIEPILYEYNKRLWSFPIPIEKLYPHFESAAVRALHLAGTIDCRKYESIQDIAYYFEAKEHFNNPYLSITNIIAPPSGKLRTMADEYAKSKSIKVFSSKECVSEKFGDFLIVLPNPEFVGYLCKDYDRYGLAIHSKENICIIQEKAHTKE